MYPVWTHPHVRGLLDHAATVRNTGDLRAATIYACAAYDYLYFTWARAVRLADGYDESYDGFRGARLSRFLEHVGVVLGMPKPDEDEEEAYPSLARLTMGLSIDEMISVRGLKDAGEVILGAPRKRPRITAEHVDAVIEAVARAAWRLEAEHPILLQLIATLRKPQNPKTRARKKAG